MLPGTDTPHVWTWTTSDVPHNQRWRAWRDLVSEVFVPLDVQPVARGAVDGRVTTTRAGDVQVSLVTADGQRVDRTPGAIRRTSDRFVAAGVQVAGTGQLAQDGRRENLRPGSFVLYDTAVPYRLDFPGPFRFLVLLLPVELARRRLGDTTAIRAHACHPDPGPLDAVSRYLTALADDFALAEPEALQRLTRVAVDLLALTADELQQKAAPEALDGRALTRNRARRFIAEHATERGLGPGAVAMAVGCSSRHLHKAFEMEAETVGGMIRRVRLERAAEELRRPTAEYRTLTAIAVAAGFRDAADLCRSFRAGYGLTPGEYRHTVVLTSNPSPPTLPPGRS